MSSAKSLGVDEDADELLERAVDGDPDALRELISTDASDEETECESSDLAAEPPPLKVEARPGEPECLTLSRAMLRPAVQGALSIREYNKWFPEGGHDLNGLVDALMEQTNQVIDGDTDRGEAMLVVQAHTLDAIFNDLVKRAARSEYLSQFEGYLKLGLRAQAQCRATWEAVSAVKNPPVASYVGQANIAQNQQVNNSASSGQNDQNPPNELLEDKSNERNQWLDRSSASEATRTDSEVETVGPIDGPQDEPGQDQSR